MSLTAIDLGNIRTIVREESRDAIAVETRNFFENEGKEILRDVVTEEVKNIFQTDGREIVRDMFQTDGREMIRDIFQTDGRQIVQETVHAEIGSLESKVTALENDIKAIYFMLAKLEKNSILVSKEFKKLTLEAKLVRINADLLAAAKQAGITLPRQHSIKSAPIKPLLLASTTFFFYKDYKFSM